MGLQMDVIGCYSSRMSSSLHSTISIYLWRFSFANVVTRTVFFLFFLFFFKRLLQVTPDLPEVQKLHRKNIIMI